MRRLAMAMAIVALVWPAASLAGDNDQRVANTLAKNLKSSETLKGFQIQVQYREGTARLEGWVRNKQQADEAVAVANRTPEIMHVINHLEIKGDAASAAQNVVPASVIKPQRLPPAPEGAANNSSGPALDQPVLRSALRSPRGSAGQPGEFKPAALEVNPVPTTAEPTVGQRHPQASAMRSLASVSPRTLPTQSGSRLDRPAQMPGTESETVVAPKPMNPTKAQRPSAQRAKPTSAASDGGWGRGGTAAAPQAQNMPRRGQPMAMPMAYPQAYYPQQAYAPQAYPQQAYAQAYPMQYQTAAYPQPVPMGGPMPVPAHVPGVGGGVAPAMYDQPNLPNYAWPTYAAYPNYAALTYPKQYSPTAWPYIGPFYPYPQVPLGWRKVTLEWDDGWWFLDFSDDRRHGCGR